MNKLDLDYQNLLKDILEKGVKKETRNGGTVSIFGWQIRHKMSEGFPVLTTKKMYFKGVVAELLWFLKGSTDIRDLWKDDCHIWDGDYEKSGRTDFDLGKIYGYQWRNWNGEIDQISELIRQLKEEPDSRRLVVSAWAVHDLPNMVLPPCHYGFQCYTRELTARERTALKSNGSTRLYDSIKEENYQTVDADDVMHTVCDEFNVPRRAISLMWNQRSVDIALGWPFNVASYGLLLEILGKMVNMVPDELICNLGDVHIYANHIDGVKEQISREPYSLPKLNINTEFWPTESGSCGEGLIDAQAVLRSFSDDNFCKCLTEEDLQLYDYRSHPKIYFPLSN